MKDLPAQSRSISLFLNSNLLEFLTQLKTALLFYENPLVYPFDEVFTQLTNDRITQYSVDRSDSFGIFKDWGEGIGDSSLTHPEVLLEDDFHHAWSECQIQDVNFRLTEAPEEDASHAPVSERQRAHHYTDEEIAAKNQELLDIFYSVHLEFYRKVYLHSAELRSEFLYGSDLHLFIAEQLLAKDLQGLLLTSSADKVREDIMLGQHLIDVIAHQYVPDLTFVHTTDIISYRRRHRVALESYLSLKAESLKEIGHSPDRVFDITREFSKRIGDISRELIIDLEAIKSKRKVAWLEKVGQPGILGLISHLIVNDWKVLGSVTLASFLTSLATSQRGSQIDELRIIQRSAAGYLFQLNEELSAYTEP